MGAGGATYTRLKVHLILQGRTLTAFSAALGTSIPQLYNVIHLYASGDRLPKDPTTRKILEAVARELGDDTILPVEPIAVDAKETV